MLLLIWRRDVAQYQINNETTLCTSMLIFTTLNNLESTLSISTLIWTMLDNVKATLSFSTSIFTKLRNVEIRCEYDHLKKGKKIKLRVENEIIFLSFKEYAGFKNFVILFPILRGICKIIFAEPQKFLKHRIYWIRRLKWFWMRFYWM